MVFVLSSRRVMSRFLARGQAGTVLVAIAPRWGERSLSLPFALYFSFQNFSFSAFSPGLHRAGTGAAFAAEAGSLRTKHRHGSARARQAQSATDRTRQLCNRSTPLHFGFKDSASIPLHSDGRKLARPSKTSGAPKEQRHQRPRDYVRPNPH
jgi:hypothetical protein